MVAHSPSSTEVDSLQLHGGHLALDLVNSVDPRGGPDSPVDYLHDFRGLCTWAARASVLDDASIGLALKAEKSHPRRSGAVWRRALALREALYRVLIAIVDGSRPQSADLELIAKEAATASTHARLVLSPEVGEWGQSSCELRLGREPDPEMVLWPLALASIDLLTDVDASRLRICPVAAGGCGWIVLDSTRNRSRRWCDMGACGTEVKSARLTARRRAQRESDG